MRDKIKTSTYLAASIIQQISNTKSDKQIKRTDLRKILYASCLNFFHTNSIFNPWPLGLYALINYYYVKRIDSDNYQLQTSYNSTSGGTSPTTVSGSCYSVSANNTHSEISAIHPDLVCSKDGEERLLIRYTYVAAKNTTQSKLGFFILNIGSKDAWKYLFSYDLVITPKPGLFPAKNN